MEFFDFHFERLNFVIKCSFISRVSRLFPFSPSSSTFSYQFFNFDTIGYMSNFFCVIVDHYSYEFDKIFNFFFKLSSTF